MPDQSNSMGIQVKSELHFENTHFWPVYDSMFSLMFGDAQLFLKELMFGDAPLFLEELQAHTQIELSHVW